MNLDRIGHPRSIAGLDGADRVTDRTGARPGPKGTPHAEPDGATMDSSELDRLVAVARSLPSARSDRIAALAAAVARGTYQVPIETLARRLLGNG